MKHKLLILGNCLISLNHNKNLENRIHCNNILLIICNINYPHIRSYLFIYHLQYPYDDKCI